MASTNSTSGGKKNLFFSGVIVLTCSNILIKAMGLLFKIPLTNLIGGEGMGYFNIAYTIYVWFYMVSTAGLPVAVSILVSESRAKGNQKEVKTIFRVTVTLFILIGLAGMSAMAFGSKLLAHIVGTEPAYLCIIAIAPTLFFICISSAIRGFFQGHQNMFPTAISQVIEALGKLGIGIAMGLYSIKQGNPIAVTAAYTISGLTISSAAGMFFLILTKCFSRHTQVQTELLSDLPIRSNGAILKNLVKIAIPITISSSVMSLTNLIDAMIVIRQLKEIGFTESVAVEIFGNYTSLAVPMYNFPPVLIYPIAYSIIPVISAAIAASNFEKAKVVMNSSLKIASLLAIPCSLGLSILAKPILNLFFNSKSVDMAAPLLSILALSVFFVCMLSITNAILQSYKLEAKPILSMTVGAIVKLVATYILIGIPKIGAYGIPIGTFLCYFVITVFNFYFVAKYVKVIPPLVEVFLKPLFASVVCGLAAIGAYPLLGRMLSSSKLVTLGTIGIAGIVYGMVILLIKAIGKEDILLLPKGQKIYAMLHQLKLM